MSVEKLGQAGATGFELRFDDPVQAMGLFFAVVGAEDVKVIR